MPCSTTELGAERAVIPERAALRVREGLPVEAVDHRLVDVVEDRGRERNIRVDLEPVLLPRDVDQVEGAGVDFVHMERSGRAGMCGAWGETMRFA